MSDFIDRLAARAIGDGIALAPRLPSWFEPLQRAPIVSSPDAGEAPPERHGVVPAAAPAPIAAPMRSAHVPTAMAMETTPAAPAAMKPGPEPTPMRATANARSAATAPAVDAPAPAATPLAIGRDLEASSAATGVLAPLPVRPRQARIASELPASAVLEPPAQGVLRPASAPVFCAMRAADTPDRPRPATTVSGPVAQSRTGHSASEPMVHVSIGRLEVRAAPVAAAPPRRREPPGGLDDYLRQRGKASP